MDGDLRNEIIALYEAQPDLLSLPGLIFAGVSRLIGAEVVSFSEFHHPSRDFRSMVSVEDDPERRGRAMQAFASHMHSHPFWQYDPAFFGERALRESDFFTEEAFLALPIAREVFLPSGARHMMAVVLTHEHYVVTIVGHRVLGRPPFSEAERDRLEAFRPHMMRSYQQAQERTLAKLTPGERLRLAFPDLTPRQLEVASLIASGKSNEEIATILGTGIDAVKAHVKAIYGKIDLDSRRAMAAVAHTVPPFAKLPPLWKLDLEAWGGRGE
ncbi:helix-turn-helix transcriptional regulator [Bosea sp. F3-2]|uniref:helix-turn-helix transcriptional regulator n=1 Tax=Bosea sp. F3-2 TaxID=2599640 RepID=UPI0011EC22FF|nr:LuxR family transcriptional regulator [Bosea sp. F3-2]QEL22342.1 helix-turn-helix transcriptional regulator [Bosea sp. F3-2]